MDLPEIDLNDIEPAYPREERLAAEVRELKAKLAAAEGRLAEVLLATGIDAPIDTIGPLEVAEHFAELQANVESVGATCAANALDRYKAERRAMAAEGRVAQGESLLCRSLPHINAALPQLGAECDAWLAGPGKEDPK